MKQSVSNYDYLSFLLLLKYMQINFPLYKTRLFVYDFIYVQTYGGRIVPGKKNILSRGRHLIYVAAAT